MTIKAIETRYAGCRFRSRLEARWAVFFDAVGVKWEYEAQGFECSTRISNWYETRTFPYLPDFWLPDLGIFAEVKGNLDLATLRKVLDAAAHLSTNGQDGCGSGPNTVVLGPIPDPTFSYLFVPVLLHMHQGSLEATPWNWLVPNNCYCGESIARDVDGYYRKDADDLLLSGLRVRDPRWGHHFLNATREGYRRARSARFEWGQSGS